MRLLHCIAMLIRPAMLSAAALALAALTGCASLSAGNPTDPFEKLNRSVFDLNEGLDRAVLKPVAQSYQAAVPRFVRLGVSNVFNNLEDLWSSVNGVLQLRPKVAVENFMRFGTNTFLGLGGILDIASEAGIERHQEDFGKTLGRWGIRSGPYLVLPLLGPTTVRDSTTIVLERRYDPINYLDSTGAMTSLTALRLVDARAGLLRLGNLLDEAALDKYSFTRDAFLQRRRAEIFRPNDDDADAYDSAPKEKSGSE